MKLNATYGTTRSMVFWPTYGKANDVTDDAFREATYWRSYGTTYWTTHSTTHVTTDRATRDATVEFLKTQS